MNIPDLALSAVFDNLATSKLLDAMIGIAIT